jgi:hypothetical protein
MDQPDKQCDICRRAVVSWPEVFTVLGPRDLCGTCYWRYREVVEQLAAFFNAEHTGLP